MRPQRLQIAKLRHITGNKKVAQDVSSRRRSAALEYLKGESFKEGFGFFQVMFSMHTRHVLQHMMRHLSYTRRRYLSCETATLNFPGKLALLYFAGLCSLRRWGGAANSLPLLPIKSRSGAILMLFCGFFDCIIENHSNAELYLLLPERRGENDRQWSESLLW